MGNFLFSAASLKMFVENVCFPEVKRMYRKQMVPSQLLKTGMGDLHWFQLIVACGIHAPLFQAHTARWLPTSIKTFCFVHYSIYRPCLVLCKYVVLNKDSNNNLFSFCLVECVSTECKLTSPSMPLKTIPTVD